MPAIPTNRPLESGPMESTTTESPFSSGSAGATRSRAGPPGPPGLGSWAICPLVACSSLGATVSATSSAARGSRSEEHTSELQSLAYLVCRLLLEKKKKKKEYKIGEAHEGATHLR